MNSFALAGRPVRVAGHRGVAGSAIARRLEREDCEIITATRNELDLLCQADIEAWTEEEDRRGLPRCRDRRWHYGPLHTFRRVPVRKTGY
jgi:hypothetical protein